MQSGRMQVCNNIGIIIRISRPIWLLSPVEGAALDLMSAT